MNKILALLLILVCTHTYAGNQVPQDYDVIVIGLGAMGSATTYQLAKAGVRVLGIDKYQPPHAQGSSYGDTRITRLAIGEGQEYVPLVLRSHEIWRSIEADSGEQLLFDVGGLIVGIQDAGAHGAADFLQNTMDVADKYQIQHTELTADQIHDKYPQFNITGNERGYYESQAGYLLPEKCIAVELQLAKRYGATLHYKEAMLSFSTTDDVVTVKTNKRTYTANKIILTVGPWIKDILPEYAALFKITRQAQFWFALKDPKEYSNYNNLPIFVWLYGTGGSDFIYGFPAIDGPNGGLKVASESKDSETTPDAVDRKVSQSEIDTMYSKIQDRLPGLSNKCVKAVACLYTVTPDHKFVIDFLPDNKNVIVASPCSGHGFKHSAAIGELLMELATEGKSTLDSSAFSFARFK